MVILKPGISYEKKGFVMDFDYEMLLKTTRANLPWIPGHENTIYGSSLWQPLSISAGQEPCIVPDELVMKVDARLVPYHRTEGRMDTAGRFKSRFNAQRVYLATGFSPELHDIFRDDEKALKNI